MKLQNDKINNPIGSIAEIYLQNERVQAELIGIDTNTYVFHVWSFKVLSGRFKGEKIAVPAYGDKFRQWIKINN